jgi:hypothetical protein
MKKYEVILEQTEHFRVIVEARDENEADDRACEMFSNGEYDELGDCGITNTNVKEIK